MEDNAIKKRLKMENIISLREHKSSGGGGFPFEFNEK